MKHFAHLNTAVQIITGYKGQQPFGIFLKDFFRQDKKYGSKDRKSIGHLCYCYFRLGKALPALEVEARVVVGLFLCSTTPNDILGQLMPAWNELVEAGVAEKMRLVSEGEYVATGKADKAANGDTVVKTTAIALQDIFPWRDLLSDGIDYNAFCASFLVQPALFLRLRPGKEIIVQQKLAAAGISFTVSGNDCLAMANASKTDEVIAFNKEAVVQDYSSQRIGEFLEKDTANEIKVWDCCAASGGKSILAYDKLGHIDLTVSDVRESIIANLRKRFAEAGITQYKSFVADISIPNAALPFTPDPDLIIADVPCSGSGTWSRTPDQLYYFDTAALERYSTLQKKIVSRVVAYLKSGGQLLYITCSAFKKENEDVVAYLQQEFALEVIKMEVLKGYDKRADTMFAALLKKA